MDLRERAIRFASSGIVGVGIFIMYVVFVTRCIALTDWNNLSRLELAILGTQISRVTLVLALEKKFRNQPLVAMVLFSFEVFLIPLLALLTFWTGDAAYTILMGAILTTWIGVSALVLSPYAIYKFVIDMAKEASLAIVVLIGSLEVGGMLFLSGVLAREGTRIQGPSGLGMLFIQFGQFKGPLSSFNGLGSNSTLFFGLVVFFVGMTAYATLRDLETDSRTKISTALLIPLSGTLGVLIWIIAFLSISSDVLLAFTIPTLIGVAALWGSSRGR